MAGLLDAFKQYISDVMPGGVLNPEGAQVAPAVKRGAEELRQGLLAYGAANKAAIENPTWGNVKAAVDNNMTAAGVAPLGMTVWHGSPHKFTKFDMSKIGTGEGAQAYGHGLYMAQNPNVAGYYTKLDYNNLAAVEHPKGGYALLDGKRDEFVTPPFNTKQEALDFKEQVAKGYNYKVDIPDEAVARFLDWDKPLSQQAPEVQKQLKRLYWENWDEIVAKNPTGEALYTSYGPGVAARSGWMDDAKFGADGAARMLDGNGIHGIRYLDGGSRANGTGSSNFVLFNDKLPRILEVNGSPTGLMPWGANEFNGLLK